MSTIVIAAGIPYTRVINEMLKQVGSRLHCPEEIDLATPRRMQIEHSSAEEWIQDAKDLARLLGKRLSLMYAEGYWQLFDPDPWDSDKGFADGFARALKLFTEAEGEPR